MAEFDPQAMDDAAVEAENNLSELSANDQLTPGIDAMIDWHYRWFMKAGHKRLGRILVGIAKEQKKEG